MTEDFGDLKPGDRAAVHRSGTMFDDYIPVVVERITPSGQIVLAGRNDRYKRNGSPVSKNERWGPFFSLVRLTPEIIEQNRRKDLLARLNEKSKDFKSLSASAIEAILAIIEGDKG